MAKVKTSSLDAKIIDVATAEKLPGWFIVSVQFTRGDEVWHQAFKLNPEHPVSLNDFQLNLLQKLQRGEIHPPTDPMAEIRGAIGSSFNLDALKEVNIKA